MRVCVTGGAGFIGSHLVERLVHDGHEVVVLDDLSTGRRENLAAVDDRIELCTGDVREAADVARALAGCMVVFHHAARASVARSLEHPREAHAVNAGGTLEVLCAARAAGVRRVVLASSSSVYGDTPELPKTPAMPTAPLSPYAASKAAGESLCRAFHASFGLETVVLRYFNVYGPRQAADSPYAAALPLFVQAMAAGRAPTLHGDGRQTRDFTYVSDVAEATVRAAAEPRAAGAVLNVGCGRQTSILQLARRIAAAVGFEGDFEYAPARAGDLRHSLAGIDETRALLGWAPAVSLAEGVARVAAAHATALARERA